MDVTWHVMDCRLGGQCLCLVAKGILEWSQFSDEVYMYVYTVNELILKITSVRENPHCSNTSSPAIEYGHLTPICLSPPSRSPLPLSLSLLPSLLVSFSL